ncbi:MAG: TonB family protein, partial [Candidatus Eiseniibacteriota bacterium]
PAAAPAATKAGAAKPVVLTASAPVTTTTVLSAPVPGSGAEVAAAGAPSALPLLLDTLFIGWSNPLAQSHRARTQVPPPDPVYPETAKRAGVLGVVRLIATVDPRGMVTGTEIVHSIPELDRAAIDAARACRFVPLGPPGIPEGFRVVVQVRFTG